MENIFCRVIGTKSNYSQNVNIFVPQKKMPLLTLSERREKLKFSKDLKMTIATLYAITENDKYFHSNRVN